MDQERASLIGRGLYTIREASALTRVPAQRIRRWTQGYSYRYKGHRRFSGPVIGSNVGRIDDCLAIDFSDLIEIRFLDAFRAAGVKWSTLHLATERARELTGRHRPFSTRIFRTDGQTILADFAPTLDDAVMLDLATNEYVWKRVIASYLYEDLEFNRHDEAALWWPLGKDRRRVVVDPERALGAPIVFQEGVPTRVLFNGFRAEGSIRAVASWYDVDEESVEDAIELEEKLAA